ncbi:MAG: hypothetical protein CBC38_00705 [Gammaproteobacteria bacterium TMED78]|mgnify:CR=1 FL=1|nr:MAG: hypothetical protein CBC38_00705 [Gammaproteobacteria bacterium TMED78]|tara:strand:- start:82930 stop:83301 length:372 start_codon:yes stop_codon:yes gene_type:complete
MKALSIFTFFIIFSALIQTSYSHHSHANYDLTYYHQLSGTVKDILWINPHIWIFIEVTDENGQLIQWALEAATPVALARNNVTRDTVKLGDMISARCHRMHDNSNACLLGYITGRDGVERLWD